MMPPMFEALVPAPFLSCHSMRKSIPETWIDVVSVTEPLAGISPLCDCGWTSMCGSEQTFTVIVSLATAQEPDAAFTQKLVVLVSGGVGMVAAVPINVLAGSPVIPWYHVYVTVTPEGEVDVAMRFVVVPDEISVFWAEACTVMSVQGLTLTVMVVLLAKQVPSPTRTQNLLSAITC